MEFVSKLNNPICFHYISDNCDRWNSVSKWKTSISVKYFFDICERYNSVSKLMAPIYAFIISQMSLTNWILCQSRTPFYAFIISQVTVIDVIRCQNGPPLKAWIISLISVSDWITPICVLYISDASDSWILCQSGTPLYAVHYMSDNCDRWNSVTKCTTSITVIISLIYVTVVILCQNGWHLYALIKSLMPVTDGIWCQIGRPL